jgi:hypothetical protein
MDGNGLQHDSLRDKNLPQLSDRPFLHPHCCLGLSKVVLKIVSEQLPKNVLILSIGSGTGLLEALLLKEYPNLQIEGVEVNHSVNRYLDQENAHVVKGTWEVSSRATEATTLLFVYPRGWSLIRKYLGRFGESKTLESIVLLGPQADATGFMAAFEETTRPFQVTESALGEFEVMMKISLTEDG